jgi:hypothetical protein
MFTSSFAQRSIWITSIAGLISSGSVLCPTTAQAAIINGDFSSGLIGWSSSGDVSIVGGQALLTTASSTQPDDFPDPTGTFNFSGDQVSDINPLETFLGVNPLDLGATATEGSGLKQQFTALAGERLSFSWQFLTNEDTPDAGFSNDAAFITLINLSTATPTITLLADTNSIFGAPTSGLGFAAETGTFTFRTGPLAAGNYLLGFSVIDDSDTSITSALLIGNVKTQTETVPEPVTTVGSLLAIGGGVLARRRKSRQNSERTFRND